MLCQGVRPPQLGLPLCHGDCPEVENRETCKAVDSFEVFFEVSGMKSDKKRFFCDLVYCSSKERFRKG